MSKNSVHYLQTEAVDEGKLKVNVENVVGNLPVEDAEVTVSYTGEAGKPIEELMTNSSGQTQSIELSTPPLDYSMEPSEQQPYAEYTLHIEARGYSPVDITGVQVFATQTALQQVKLVPQASDVTPIDNIVIPANTLFGVFPPKIPEAEIKPIPESGEIVLSRVVIPQYMVVHDGAPTDRTAQDYYVTYKDYIKNVASSEVYSTWPDATLRSNILAIMSFSLNRVYTEWYVAHLQSLVISRVLQPS